MSDVNSLAGLNAEKLEWGNHCHLDQIKQKYSNGFDIILGADIYILTYNSFTSYHSLLISFSNISPP